MSVKKTTYAEVMQEYRTALAMWSEAKALYSPDGPELIAAAVHLEEIENALEAIRRPLAA